MARKCKPTDVQPVVLVNTSSRSVSHVSNATPVGPESSSRKRLRKWNQIKPELKDWLDRVFLPILLKEIHHGDSGLFTSKGFRLALRRLCALLFEPAV
jgi:hypothetical protein